MLLCLCVINIDDRIITITIIIITIAILIMVYNDYGINYDVYHKVCEVTVETLSDQLYITYNIYYTLRMCSSCPDLFIVKIA